MVVTALVATGAGQTSDPTPPTTPQNSLICQFFSASFEFLGNVYVCDAQVVGDVNNWINAVLGTHEAGRTNSHVQRLNVENQRLVLIPLNLNQFFPNLISLRIVNTGLFDIIAGDIYPFPNLQVLDFHDNELWWIDANLFDHTLNLRWVNFGANIIQRVERNAFARQSQLEWLSFSGNTCTSRWGDTRAAVLQVIPLIEDDCSGFFSKDEGLPQTRKERAMEIEMLRPKEGATGDLDSDILRAQ